MKKIHLSISILSLMISTAVFAMGNKPTEEMLSTNKEKETSSSVISSQAKDDSSTQTLSLNSTEPTALENPSLIKTQVNSSLPLVNGKIPDDNDNDNLADNLKEAVEPKETVKDDNINANKEIQSNIDLQDTTGIQENLERQDNTKRQNSTEPESNQAPNTDDVETKSLESDEIPSLHSSDKTNDEALSVAAPEEQTQQPKVISDSSVQALLENHRWQLIAAKKSDGSTLVGLEHLVNPNKPNVELRFFNGRVNASHTCNQQMAGFSLDENHQITFGPVAQNMRACIDPDIAIRDDSIISILSTAQVPSIDNSAEQPLMTLKDANNTEFTFRGMITPEAYFNQEGVVLFFEVKPELESCTLEGIESIEGAACLSVREIKYDESFKKVIVDEAWHQVPVANIQDFNLEVGYYHTIRVKRFEFDKAVNPSDVPFEGVTTKVPFYVLELVVEMSEPGQK